MSVQSPLVVLRIKEYEKEAAIFMASQKMRITLKAYDHQLIDFAAAKLAYQKRSGYHPAGGTQI